MNDVFLESWDRQAQIIESLAGLVDEGNRKKRPSEDGMPLDLQLAHIHLVRCEWLKTAMPSLTEPLKQLVEYHDGEASAIADLKEIKSQLELSTAAVRKGTEIGLESGGKFGPYDHAIFFLQHMIWHEGYHAALILLALRHAGQDPSEEWNEKHIWELWRGPEEW